MHVLFVTTTFSVRVELTCSKGSASSNPTCNSTNNANNFTTLPIVTANSTIETKEIRCGRFYQLNNLSRGHGIKVSLILFWRQSVWYEITWLAAALRRDVPTSLIFFFLRDSFMAARWLDMSIFTNSIIITLMSGLPNW